MCCLERSYFFFEVFLAAFFVAFLAAFFVAIVSILPIRVLRNYFAAVNECIECRETSVKKKMHAKINLFDA